jgi:hypothetical protein
VWGSALCACQLLVCLFTSRSDLKLRMILPALISHDWVNFLGSSPASEHGVHTASTSIFVGAVILTSPLSLSREIQGELVHGDSSGRQDHRNHMTRLGEKKRHTRSIFRLAGISFRGNQD